MSVATQHLEVVVIETLHLVAINFDVCGIVYTELIELVLFR